MVCLIVICGITFKQICADYNNKLFDRCSGINSIDQYKQMIR